MMRQIILLTVVSIVLCQDAVLNKVLLKDPAALCLDGTPGAYYIERGSDPLKILLFF